MQFAPYKSTFNYGKEVDLMYQQNYSFLDVITILSFMLQLQNQDKLFDINDIQRELQKVQDRIDNHLQIQDDKIDAIIAYLKENSGE